MRTLAQIIERQTAIKGELTDITQRSEPLDGDVERTDTLLTEWDDLEAERIPLAERAAKLAAVQAAALETPAPKIERSQAPAVIVRTDPFAVLDDRSVVGRSRTKALADSLLRANEDLIEDADAQRTFERQIKRHARDHEWAENILARSKEEYAEAFSAVMTGQTELLTDVQRAALSVGTNANGGYLVPTFLDPTIMLTSAGSSNVLRQYATIKTLTTGRTWNGVTSAGVTASWDAELAEVSDDSPNDIGNPSVSLVKPQAWIGASIEAFEDIAGLQSDALLLFADARDVLEGGGFMTGSGTSNQPLGLFTAINASASLQVVSTTAATIGEVDLAAVKQALPQRFRRRDRARWVMNGTYAEAIKRLGTAVASTYSGDLTQPTADIIKGYGVVESDDAPTTQTTTAKDQEIVFADLTQFVIVDKPGSTSIEFVPITFGSNGRPNGGRGWYMHWRTGSGMPVLNAGRILVDKTSA